jgi:hypothetical protein
MAARLLLLLPAPTFGAIGRVRTFQLTSRALTNEEGNISFKKREESNRQRHLLARPVGSTLTKSNHSCLTGDLASATEQACLALQHASVRREDGRGHI